jgi:hypothetical protein
MSIKRIIPEPLRGFLAEWAQWIANAPVAALWGYQAFTAKTRGDALGHGIGFGVYLGVFGMATFMKFERRRRERDEAFMKEMDQDYEKIARMHWERETEQRLRSKYAAKAMSGELGEY